ncbi:hypothetical protein [Streptomyces sp. ZSW22]|uniref:hypothetical protein n=1 Tax=Streptomyces sp. ZSW22 TaxID=3055050 RepID=UPI0025B0A8AF|nr:hypothetical protein [Streptomyces sp. ZSW22]MDN3244144.1 hypothetical protein [Streptomyces sp. ZSW22]
MSHPPPPGKGWPPPPPPPARPRWGRFAAWTAGAAIAAFAIGGGVAVLTDDDGEQIANPAACKDAMTEAMQENAGAGEKASPADSLPTPCVGLNEEVLQRLMGEAITEYWDSPEADRVFEDAWREALESAYPSAGP